MTHIFARSAALIPRGNFQTFGELISQPPLTALAQVELTLGETLIKADCELHHMMSVRFEADRDRWHQTAAMLAIGLLLGAVIGCVTVTRLAGR